MDWDTLTQTAQELGEAERRVKALRNELDRKLSRLHRDGASVAGLARATGLSRETVYTSIRRVRASPDDADSSACADSERERLEEMERLQLEWEREHESEEL